MCQISFGGQALSLPARGSSCSSDPCGKDGNKWRGRRGERSEGDRKGMRKAVHPQKFSKVRAYGG